MHIHKRIPIVAALLIVALSFGIVTLSASLVDRHRAAEELLEAVEDAGDMNASGRGIYSVKALRERELLDVERRLQDVGRDKRAARMRVAWFRGEAVALKEVYGIDASSSGAVLAMVEEEAGAFAEFIRYVQARRATGVRFGPGLGVLRRLLVASLGEITDFGITADAVERARMSVLRVVLRAQRLGEELPEAEAEYARQMVQYAEAWKAYLDAQQAVADADERIAEVQRITGEVNAQVIRLTSQLNRIDAQLRARIERDLIEKGLMDSQPGERSDGRVRGEQRFLWPARGSVSSGFLNAAYEAFFGVPHRGIDIVVPHGTPVVAATDGIIFLVRDGGQFGYSYILIGHRDGYATLYGHLSRFNIGNGQEVAAGQVIGWSGGMPGSYGAGPMTTGPHLHFEVLHSGVHINPVVVLP